MAYSGAQSNESGIAEQNATHRNVIALYHGHEIRKSSSLVVNIVLIMRFLERLSRMVDCG